MACAGLIGCRAPAPGPTAALDPDRDPEVASVYAAGRVFVYASVNGAAPERFLFDTGASVNAITPGAAHALGLTPAAPARVTDSNDHARTLPVGVAGTVELGPVTLSGVRFVVTEDAGDERGAVAGIIGLDGLSAFTVEINYPARRLRITDDRIARAERGALPFRPLDGPTVSVPLRIDPHADTPVWALLDTAGATALRLDPAASRRHALTHAARPVDFTRGLHGTTRVVTAAPLAGPLRIGDTGLHAVLADINQPRNLLGFRLLRNFRVRIDGPSRLVAFSPASPDPSAVAASPGATRGEPRLLP
jgi:predicted aspartyl protease